MAESSKMLRRAAVIAVTAWVELRVRIGVALAFLYWWMAVFMCYLYSGYVDWATRSGHSYWQPVVRDQEGRRFTIVPTGVPALHFAMALLLFDHNCNILRQFMAAVGHRGHLALKIRRETECVFRNAIIDLEEQKSVTTGADFLFGDVVFSDEHFPEIASSSATPPSAQITTVD